MKRVILCLVLVFVAIVIAVSYNPGLKKQSFSGGEFKIHIPEDFEDKSYGSTFGGVEHFSYHSRERSISFGVNRFGFSKTFSLFNTPKYELELWSPEEFLRNYISHYVPDVENASEIFFEDDIVYFRVENSTVWHNDERYCKFVTVFKGKNAFWLVTYNCYEKNYSEYEVLFKEWAKGAEYKPYVEIPFEEAKLRRTTCKVDYGGTLIEEVYIEHRGIVMAYINFVAMYINEPDHLRKVLEAIEDKYLAFNDVDGVSVEFETDKIDVANLFVYTISIDLTKMDHEKYIETFGGVTELNDVSESRNVYYLTYRKSVMGFNCSE